jgi:hypothetical protein
MRLFHAAEPSWERVLNEAASVLAVLAASKGKRER